MGTTDPALLGRRLVLGMTSNVALTILPALLPQLRADAPDLDVGVQPIDRRVAPDMLARGRVDAALGSWTGELPPGLARYLIYEERLVLVARRGHPLLCGTVTPEAITAYPHVLVSPSGEAWGPVDQALSRLDLARRIALVVPDYRFALEAISANDDFVGVVASGALERAGQGLDLDHCTVPLHLEALRIELVAQRSAASLTQWLLARMPLN